MTYYVVLLLLCAAVTLVARRNLPTGSAFAIGAAMTVPDVLRGIAPRLGSIPPAYLSETTFPLVDGPLWAWALFAVYASWYGVPFVAAAAGRWAPLAWASVGLTMAIGFTLTGLLPLSPPWMETGRLFGSLPVVSGLLASDPYPHAAFPSMHVALPASIAVASAGRARGWWFAYTALLGVVVVLSREHWMVDVIAALALAVVVRWCVDVYASTGVLGATGVGENVHDERDGGGVGRSQSRPADILDV